MLIQMMLINLNVVEFCSHLIKSFVYFDQGWHDRGILVLNGICIRYLIPQGIDSSSIPQVLNTSRKKYGSTTELAT